MLPPIDDSILQSNPQFAALHTHLTTNIFNPNGSTKHHPAQKERDAVSSALKASQTRALKTSIITTALQNLDISPTTTTPAPLNPKLTKRPPAPPSQLPTELLELILLLSSRLSSSSPQAQTQAQTALLESTTIWQSLPAHLPRLAALLSTYLHTQSIALSRILSPSTNASFLHRIIPSLVPSILALQNTIVSKKALLHTSRALIVTSTLRLLRAYERATALTVQVLETCKHGALSLERHYGVRMGYLAGLGEKVRLEALEKRGRGERAVYSEAVRGALAEYVGCLGDGRARLRERGEGAERVLWGYGVGRKSEGESSKEKVMKEVARVYGELVREIGEVGRDVERLKGRR